MIIYWIIVAFRWLKWIIVPPKPQDVACADLRERCPVCGWRQANRIRCVAEPKPAPQNAEVAAKIQILRRHTCEICGARWHHQPIAGDITPEKVLPSIPRTELEAKEDRQVLLQQAEQTPAA